MALWLLLYPYAGLRHDTRLYTLQALYQIAPALYGNDIFLCFGSQDSYTLFTPIYAHLAASLGIEHAAALLTAIGQLGFLATCWILSRRIASPKIAALSIGLVLILPGNYGSDFVFTYLETFITPRLFAEALTLLAIASFLADRRIPGTLLLISALLLHPLMAMAGVAFLASGLVLRYPKRLVPLAIMAMLVAIPILLSPLASALRFDDEWLTIVDQRSPYLFMLNWTYADWARLSVPLATLVISALISTNSLQRKIAKTALLTAIGGLLVTLVGNDALRLIIVTQGQAWRWLWLSTVLSLLLLMPLLQQLWHANKAGRVAALLLAAAWLIRNEPSSLGIAVLAISAGFASYRNLGTANTWNKLWLASCALLAAIMVWITAMYLLTANILLYTYHWPNWLDLYRQAFENGLLPLLMLAVAYLATTAKQRWLPLLSASVFGFLLIGLAGYSWQNWTYEEYPASLIASMQDWRRVVPPGEDVLWMDGPTPTWMALQRPSYISEVQATVVLFSRPAAMELKRRANEVSTIFPDAKPLVWTGRPEMIKPLSHTLNEICAHIGVHFLVTSETLDAAPLAKAPLELPASYRDARLYQCKGTT
jgi:hypothetical protein